MKTAGMEIPETIAAEGQACEFESLRHDLQTWLAKIQAESGVPGISIALSLRGQRIAVQAGSLCVDDRIALPVDARFQLGCITKLLTCLVAAMLIEDGKLDEHAPIGEYLAEIRDSDKGREIAVWHLMSHTSGYIGPNIVDPAHAYYYTWQKFIAFLIQTPQLFKPGTVFSYEHSEHVLLGEIIQRVTGEGIVSLFQRRLFEPLGLVAGTIRGDQTQAGRFVVDHTYDASRRTFARVAAIPYGKFWSASLSDLTMSLPDLLCLAEAMAGIGSRAGNVENGPSRAALEFVQKQVTTLPVMIGSTGQEQMPAAFGVGCAAYRGWLLGHNGSARGQTCGLRFDPRHGLAIVVGMNAWQPFLRDRIINHLLGALRGDAFPKAPLETVPSPVGNLVGEYVGTQGTALQIALSGSSIVCSLGKDVARRFEIVLQQDHGGHWIPRSDMQHHSLGFFPDPEDGEPCAMWGLVALRRTSR